jgi:rare lipoprotein A
MKPTTAVLVALVAVTGCTTTRTARPEPREPRPPEKTASASASRSSPARRSPDAAVERPFAAGQASYYGEGFHGRLTANGERFNRHGLTAAHRKLKFNSCVVVENTLNGKRLQVRVNDRGPYIDGRIIDVSEGAARRLGMLDKGVVPVRLYRCRG